MEKLTLPKLGICQNNNIFLPVCYFPNRSVSCQYIQWYEQRVIKILHLTASQERIKSQPAKGNIKWTLGFCSKVKTGSANLSTIQKSSLSYMF